MSAPQNKSFPVSWDQFHRDSRALAWRLNSEGPFDAIVCITRGGLVPAAIIARELGIRVIESVSISSYEYKDQGKLQVLKSIADDILALDAADDKKVLIVDDDMRNIFSLSAVLQERGMNILQENLFFVKRRRPWYFTLHQ